MGMSDTYWYPMVRLWRNASYNEFMAYRIGLEWAWFGEWPPIDPIVWATGEEV